MNPLASISLVRLAIVALAGWTASAGAHTLAQAEAQGGAEAEPPSGPSTIPYVMDAAREHSALAAERQHSHFLLWDRDSHSDSDLESSQELQQAPGRKLGEGKKKKNQSKGKGKGKGGKGGQPNPQGRPSAGQADPHELHQIPGPDDALPPFPRRPKNLFVYQHISTSFTPTLVVAKDGSGNFTKVQAALDSLAKQKKKHPHPVLMYVKKGVYYEKITVPRSLRYLTIVGDPGKTKITYDAYSARLGQDGQPLGTGLSGSMIVLADDFTMINMVVENSTPRPQQGVVGQQAVAFKASGNRTLVFNSSFYSYQDTLYAHKNLQYYVDCFIYGSVDFVFGGSKSIFENCTFFMDSTGYAGITAHYRTDPKDDLCFVILGSRLTGKLQGWLGRAWGPYACTIFAWTYMDKAIAPEGWNDFGVQARRLTSYYAEHGNSGIGASLDGRVWWEKKMTQQQVKYYLTQNWIGLSTWMKPLPIAPGSDWVRPPNARNCKADTPVQIVRNLQCFSCCSAYHAGSKQEYRACMKACK